MSNTVDALPANPGKLTQCLKHLKPSHITANAETKYFVPHISQFQIIGSFQFLCLPIIMWGRYKD